MAIGSLTVNVKFTAKDLEKHIGMTVEHYLRQIDMLHLLTPNNYLKIGSIK